MKRTLLLLSVLALFPQAVSAKTRLKLFGNSAGYDYCRMRFAGVSHDQALDVAISENMASRMQEPVINMRDGDEATLGLLDMVEYIDTNCFDQWRDTPEGATI